MPNFRPVNFRKSFCSIVVAIMVFSLSVPPAIAQELNLPAPSKIKPISKTYQPTLLKAVTIDQKDPFLFDFLVDTGDSNLQGEALEAETQKLVKYFLAALTIPENDLWVNLSPYEKDAMIPQVLGVTELGKDLLVGDYYLKQVTAGLTNPNTETGKKFWSTAYAKAQEMFGTTEVPINTFSKVWIVPDNAVVLEKDGSAFVVESHLKAFLEEDYLAVKKNFDNKEIGTDKLGEKRVQDINALSSQIIKDLVLPLIEKEVNTGENFAMLRQIYNSAVLAAWYKKRLKETILGQLYADQGKVAGVNSDDMEAGEKIYDKYTAALKTGVYNLIKQDYDLSSQKVLQRKYFSGGVQLRASSALKTFEVNNVQDMDRMAQTNPVAARAATDLGLKITRGSSTLVTAKVQLGNTSVQINQLVNRRLQGDDQSASSSLEEILAVSASSQVTADSLDDKALRVLATMKPDQASRFARENGFAEPEVERLRQGLDSVLSQMPLNERGQSVAMQDVARSNTVGKAVMQSLEREAPEFQALEIAANIQQMPAQEFETKLSGFLIPAQAELRRYRDPSQSVFTLITNNNGDPAQLFRPDVREVFAPTIQPELQRANEEALALNVALTMPAPILERVVRQVAAAKTSYSEQRINSEVSHSEAQRKARQENPASNPSNLAAIVQLDPGAFLREVRISDPVSTQVLINIARAENLSSELRSNGFNDATVVSVTNVKAALDAIVKENPRIVNNPQRFAEVAAESPEVQAFMPALKNAALSQTLITQSLGSGFSNPLDEQTTAAGTIAAMDQTTFQRTIDAPELNLTVVQREEFSRDFAKVQQARQASSNASWITALQGTSIANEIGQNRNFVKAVNSSRSAIAASSVVSVAQKEMVENLVDPEFVRKVNNTNASFGKLAEAANREIAAAKEKGPASVRSFQQLPAVRAFLNALDASTEVKTVNDIQSIAQVQGKYAVQYAQAGLSRIATAQEVDGIVAQFNTGLSPEDQVTPAQIKILKDGRQSMYRKATAQAALVSNPDVDAAVQLLAAKPELSRLIVDNLDIAEKQGVAQYIAASNALLDQGIHEAEIQVLAEDAGITGRKAEEIKDAVQKARAVSNAGVSTISRGGQPTAVLVSNINTNVRFRSALLQAADQVDEKMETVSIPAVAYISQNSADKLAADLKKSAAAPNSPLKNVAPEAIDRFAGLVKETVTSDPKAAADVSRTFLPALERTNNARPPAQQLPPADLLLVANTGVMTTFRDAQRANVASQTGLSGDELTQATWKASMDQINTVGGVAAVRVYTRNIVPTRASSGLVNPAIGVKQPVNPVALSVPGRSTIQVTSEISPEFRQAVITSIPKDLSVRTIAVTATESAPVLRDGNLVLSLSTVEAIRAGKIGAEQLQVAEFSKVDIDTLHRKETLAARMAVNAVRDASLQNLVNATGLAPADASAVYTVAQSHPNYTFDEIKEISSPQVRAVLEAKTPELVELGKIEVITSSLRDGALRNSPIADVRREVTNLVRNPQLAQNPDERIALIAPHLKDANLAVLNDRGGSQRANAVVKPSKDMSAVFKAGVTKERWGEVTEMVSASHPEFNSGDKAALTNVLSQVAASFDEAALRAMNKGALGEHLTTDLAKQGIDPAKAQDMAKAVTDKFDQVGGIDLSAEQMGLQIKRDGNGVPLPISSQDIQNMRIDGGLSPVILDMQPATPQSVPYLMNLSQK